jgi:REP element-mobilizing transposase RayT
MARPLRIEYEGAFYHVTGRGNEQRKIYNTEADYGKFKLYLGEAQEKYGHVLHCYVLMPNHYHLIVETPRGNLNRVMHFINGSYTNYFNLKWKRSGHLFQGRYKAILIDRDAYLLELSRYVHLNPVRAKMVLKPEDYPHSSYQSFVYGREEGIVCRDLILEIVTMDKKSAPRRYRDFVESAIAENLDNPLRNVYAGAILGEPTFIRESLGRLRDGVLQKEEISYRRGLKAAYGSDEIIETISHYFKVSRDDVLRNRIEYRNMGIYLMKKLTGMTNRQIGELFEGLSYSAVAKAYQRFSVNMRRERALRKKIEGIEANLSSVKG